MGAGMQKRALVSKKGQGLTEYAVLLLLIVLLLIAVVPILKNAVVDAMTRTQTSINNAS